MFCIVYSGNLSVANINHSLYTASGMKRDRTKSLQQFAQARRQAQLDALAARLIGRDIRALPFAAIRHKLRQRSPLYRGVRDVPIEQIVGSVGRYHEFSREFLPLNDDLRERWVNIDRLARATAGGWPPVELYKVGDVYFVRDGHHRVSVAHQLESPTVEAEVWEFPEDIHINPDDTLDEVLIRFSEREFMERTGLEKRYPDHGIRFTSPGRYSELLAQIEDLQEKLSIIDETPMPYEEAVDAWYELIYLPTVQIIQDTGLLDRFPGRTKADLFAWLSKHREGLRAVYGEYDNLADLAQMLADHYEEGSINKLMRQFRRWLGSEDLPPLVEVDERQEKL